MLVVLRLLLVTVLLPVDATAQVERRLERTFQAASDSVVTVRIGGGSITVDGGPATMNLDTSSGSIRVGRALGVSR